jgi:Piwi domain
MPQLSNPDRIALNFLGVRPHSFAYRIYRKELESNAPSEEGTRHLPREILLNGGHDETRARGRYCISLTPRDGFEEVAVPSYVDSGLTTHVLQTALTVKVKELGPNIEFDEGFIKRIAFVLYCHEAGVREVIWLKAYHLRVLRRFGFLLDFALRIPGNSNISDKRRLQLSLTHKNGRVNEDYYLDHYDKIEKFLRRYLNSIRQLTLHDGSNVELEGKLAVISSFALSRRVFVFGDDKEGKSQFFGLRTNGPLKEAPENGHLVFLFQEADRAKSQDLFRALRGDTYSTFPGMQQMFRLPFGRSNVSGLEVAGFDNESLKKACQLIRKSYDHQQVLPFAVVPMSKHSSPEETTAYYAAKHAFLSERFASQFVDRKRFENRNALQWSISNLGLAAFAKLGGIPWKLRPSTEGCLVVGIGQAHRVVNRHIERYLAYSVLSDSSGVYENIKLLGNSNDPEEYRAALKANLRAVLLEHKNTYNSFVIHLTFSMKRREIEAIQELVNELKDPSQPATEFVVLKFNDHNDFFGFSIAHNSRMPFEGVVAPLSQRDFLVWFSGLSLEDSKVPKKPERPVHVRILYPPQPLGDAELKRVLQDAFNIAGANWRGFNAKSLPISVYYAKLIADYYAHFREAGLPEIDFDEMSPWFL